MPNLSDGTLVVFFKIATFVSFCFNDYYICSMKKESVTPAQKSVIRRTTYPIGKVFEVNGVYVRCIERPYVESSCDACIGCYFSQENKTCPPSQCSTFGRTDGKNVWFVKVSNE